VVVAHLLFSPVLQLNSIKVLPAKKTKNKYQTTEFIFFFLLDSERTTLAGSIPKNQFLHNKVSLSLFVIPHSSFVGHVLLLFSNSDFVVGRNPGRSVIISKQLMVFNFLLVGIVFSYRPYFFFWQVK
jgi:hypothetical protein